MEILFYYVEQVKLMMTSNSLIFAILVAIFVVVGVIIIVFSAKAFEIGGVKIDIVGCLPKLIICFFVLAGLGGISSLSFVRTPSLTTTSQPTPTPSPTATPQPTPTPSPTAAPQPSPTPLPTATPQPSPTPSPTATPQPSPVWKMIINNNERDDSIPGCTPRQGYNYLTLDVSFENLSYQSWVLDKSLMDLRDGIDNTGGPYNRSKCNDPNEQWTIEGRHSIRVPQLIYVVPIERRCFSFSIKNPVTQEADDTWHIDCN